MKIRREGPPPSLAVSATRRRPDPLPPAHLLRCPAAFPLPHATPLLLRLPSPDDPPAPHLLPLPLSLSLRRFFHFPFAANLLLLLPLAPPRKPYILYSYGNSLTWTIEESAANFVPRDATPLLPLVPPLLPPRMVDGAQVASVAAI